MNPLQGVGWPVVTTTTTAYCPPGQLLNTTTGFCQVAYRPEPLPPMWLFILLIVLFIAIMVWSYIDAKRHPLRRRSGEKRKGFEP